MTRKDLPPYVYTETVKGHTYHYFRRGKGPRVRVYPDDAGFWAQYHILREGRTPIPTAKTLKKLAASYRRSSRYTALAPRTKADYDKVLAYIERRMPDLSAVKMQRKDVIRAQHANADATRFANYVVQVFSVLFEHAIDQGWRSDNPAKGVRRLKGAQIDRQPWPVDLVEAYRAKATGRALLVFELALGTGQRIGDVLRMQWGHVEGDAIRVRQGKTGADLLIPLTARLRAVLRSTPRTGLYIVAGKHGAPLSYRQASHAVRAVREQIGAQAYDIHALRYTAASELAEAGCSDELIQAVTGHRSAAMVRRYSAAARQKARARQAQEKRE